MATAGRCARRCRPGNTADVGSLAPVVDRLRKRFSIDRVCIVADRGMISAETIAELEARGLFYILGVRERSDKLVRELVLDDPAPSVRSPSPSGTRTSTTKPRPLLSPDAAISSVATAEMEEDAAARATILAALNAG